MDVIIFFSSTQGADRALRRRRHPAWFSIVFVLSAGLIASPANAQLGDFVGYLRKAYDIYNTKIDPQPSEISQLKALVIQSKSEIISEIDNVVAAEIASCAINTIDTFGAFDSLTADNRQRLAIDSSKCITDAEQQIAAVADLKAVNKMGLALNAMAPIALAANRYAGLPTAPVRDHIIATNKKLLDRLKPFCAVSIDDPSDLPRWSGSVKGRGACYNFNVAKPAQIDPGRYGGVFHLTPGTNRGFLYWQLTGKAYSDDEVFYWRGHHVFYPVVNYSIAQTEAMRGTSWEVAKVVLETFESPASPLGSPLAITMSNDAIYKPMDIFVANGRGAVWRAALTPSDPSNPTLSSWDLTSNPFTSVAAAANHDGRVELFGLGRSGRIYHRWQKAAGDNSSWAPISEREGLLSSIAVARNSDGTLQLFGTNPSGQIYTTAQILGGDQWREVQPHRPKPATDSWTNFLPMDGLLTQVSAVTGGGFIHLFGVNSAGALWHRHQLVKNATDPAKPGSWSPWTRIEAPAPMMKLTVALDLGGRINVVALTGDYRIFHSVLLGERNTAWVQISGKMRDIVMAKEGGGAGMLVLIGVGAGDGNSISGTARAGRMYRRVSYGLIHRTADFWAPDAWKDWVAIPSPIEDRLEIDPTVSQ